MAAGLYIRSQCPGQIELERVSKTVETSCAMSGEPVSAP